jgi:septum formation protein
VSSEKNYGMAGKIARKMESQQNLLFCYFLPKSLKMALIMYILMEVVLASRSPRRKRILEEKGYKVIVDISNADEDSVENSNIKELVMEIAKLKAETVAHKHKNSIIVAADSLLYFNGKPIGQQNNDADAEKILRMIIGKTHEVYSGVCVINTKTQKVLMDSDVSMVTLKKVSDETLKSYIKSKQYRGKAGAYNLADPEFESFVANIDGSYTNILGLPIDKVDRMIKRISE